MPGILLLSLNPHKPWEVVLFSLFYGKVKELARGHTVSRVELGERRIADCAGRPLEHNCAIYPLQFIAVAQVNLSPNPLHSLEHFKLILKG